MSSLQGPPFELLSSCSLRDLSRKVLFLVALATTRRVGELQSVSSSVSSSCSDLFLSIFRNSVRNPSLLLTLFLVPSSFALYGILWEIFLMNCFCALSVLFRFIVIARPLFPLVLVLSLLLLTLLVLSPRTPRTSFCGVSLLSPPPLLLLLLLPPLPLPFSSGRIAFGVWLHVLLFRVMSPFLLFLKLPLGVPLLLSLPFTFAMYSLLRIMGFCWVLWLLRLWCYKYFTIAFIYLCWFLLFTFSMGVCALRVHSPLVVWLFVCDCSALGTVRVGGRLLSLSPV